MDSQTFMIPGGNYGYTGTIIDQIESFKNTIAQMLFDESGSTRPYARQMELVIKEIIKSLRASPVADQIIYRQCHFGTNFREFHGYEPISAINEDRYDGCYQPGGQTHLYDAIDRSVLEMIDYADQLAKKRYTTNGVLYLVSDGDDYGSTLSLADARKAMAKGISSESLESMLSVMVGLSNNDATLAAMEKFAKDVGFTQFLPVKDTSEATLLRIGQHASQTIVSQSQHLGTGGPSQALKF